jgi:tetratricopeptide (TPR) repeat protein
LRQQVDNLPVNHRIWIEEGSEVVQKEAFVTSANRDEVKGSRVPQKTEVLPLQVETWLLMPVVAPDFALDAAPGKAERLSDLRGKPVLMYFGSTGLPDWEKQLRELKRANESWRSDGLQLVVVNVGEEAKSNAPQQGSTEARWTFPVATVSLDIAAVYNLLYGRLFDRHRDMGLPTAFLLDAQGEIVKVYQGPLGLMQVQQDARQIPQSAEARLKQGLPFTGVIDTYEVGRNYLSFGAVFYDRGYFDQAETYFQLAEKDDPGGAEALYGLGSVYLEQRKNKEAWKYFRRATEAQSNYPGTLPNAWNNLGILAAREGKTDEAIGYFQKVLQLSPEHAVALDNLGSAYRQKKDWENAKIVLEKALTVNPEDAEANYSLGMVYAQQNETQRAYEYLQRALAAKPDYPEALNNLGILYLRTKRPEEARHSFEESIRVAPDYEQSYLNLARLFVIEGDKAQARRTLEQLLKIHPGQAQAQKELEELPQ